MFMKVFLFSILILPLGSASILLLFGRFIGRKGAHIIAPLSIFLSFIGSVYSFFILGISGDYAYIMMGNWFRTGDLVVDWGFVFDSLSLTMFVVVTLVSFCVHLYSVDYMGADPGFIRFMSLISLFTFFMLFLVSADNFVQLLVGWEGVGICSFLLVSFWFSRPQAIKAAIKALLVNRIGDCGFLFGILLVFKIFRTLNFDVIFLISPFLKIHSLDFKILGVDFSINYLTLCNFFLLFGICGKSAQLGLHVWLPDAMEGPTPVSALIHAATMVTAGVFLVLRCSFLFEQCPEILSLLMLFGGATVFFGSVVGLTQFDIKKVIAYSTCSQLGYMLVACGCSNYSGAFFHLVNHAFIKALLFLTAGVVIAKLGGEQDIRKMGGLQHSMPLTYVFMLIGSCSLAGFPFLSGYYSKDLILELTNVRICFSGLLVYWLISLSTFLTSFYSFRLVFLVFITKTNIPFTRFYKLQDVSTFVAIPLSILAFLSIFSGYFLFDLFLGIGTDFFQDVFPYKKTETSMELEMIPEYLKLCPTVFSVFGFLLGIYFDHIVRSRPVKKVIRSKTINCALHVDSFYNRGIVMPLLRLALIFCFRMFDKYFLEMFGSKGLFYVLKMVFFSKDPIVGGRTDRLVFISIYLLLMLFILFSLGFF
jgi:NADH-ubiquinone oxidoreductase chain 5